MSSSERRLLACAVILLSSCDVPEEIANVPRELEALPLDTIGVPMGDGRYVFGDILSVEFSFQENGILVLDGSSCTIRSFSIDGDYMGEYAGKGSGPGQLLDPMDMAVLSDGRTAVADWGAWGVVLYDSEMNYIGSLAPMQGGSPMALAPGAAGSFTGLGLLFPGETGEYFLGSWSESTDEDFRFLQGPARVIPGEEGEIEISFPNVVFDSDPQGNLYAALSTDSTFSIQRFSPWGEPESSITEIWEREPMNQACRAEMQRETELLGEEFPEEVFSTAIAGLYCDGESRLWVRMGTSPNPLFRVYERNGEFLRTVVCSDLYDPFFELEFTMDRGKILAWNTDPEDYPRIIVLEDPLEEQQF